MAISGLGAFANMLAYVFTASKSMREINILIELSREKAVCVDQLDKLWPGLIFLTRIWDSFGTSEAGWKGFQIYVKILCF